MPAPFNLKLTADFFDAAGKPKYQDIGLSVLAAAPHIQQSPFTARRSRPSSLRGPTA